VGNDVRWRRGWEDMRQGNSGRIYYVLGGIEDTVVAADTGVVGSWIVVAPSMSSYQGWGCS